MNFLELKEEIIIRAASITAAAAFLSAEPAPQRELWALAEEIEKYIKGNK